MVSNRLVLFIGISVFSGYCCMTKVVLFSRNGAEGFGGSKPFLYLCHCLNNSRAVREALTPVDEGLFL